MIKVPGELKADDPKLEGRRAENQKTEKAKGNNAEVKRKEKEETAKAEELKRQKEAEEAQKAQDEDTQKKTEIDNANELLNEITAMKDNANKAFQEQMSKDGIFEDIADGVSKIWNNDLFGGGTGNTAAYVRKDFEDIDKGTKNMKKLLTEGDMEGFKSAFEETYHHKYNQQAIDDFMNTPKEQRTPEQFKAAFGESRIANMEERVANYNDSQDTGGTVVKTGVVAAATTVTGGAGGVIIASGVTALDKATAGVGQEDANIENMAGKMLDNVKNFSAADYGEIAVDGALGAAGKAIEGFKMGSKVAKAVMGQAPVNGVVGKVAHKIGSKVVSTAADEVASLPTNALADGIKQAITGNKTSIGESAKNEALGVLGSTTGDSSATRAKKGFSQVANFMRKH